MTKRTPKFRLALVAALALGALSAAPAGADVTLGQVAQGVSSPGACPITGDGFVLDSGDNLNPYVVPSGGGEITQWSTSWASSGSQLTLVVMRPSGLALDLVTWDSETFPSGLSGHVATFTLGHPIAVAAGDVIGLYGEQIMNVPCEFTQPSGNSVEFVQAALGQSVILTDGSTIATQNDALPNVSATLVQSADLSVSAPATVAASTIGGLVQFSVAASSGGASEGATVTDTLSGGLTPLSAAVGAVACSVSGQSFSCPVAGEPATISVLAQASAAGSATNTATIAGTLTDPVGANNSVSTSVSITAAATQSAATTASSCKLAPLQGLRLAAAQTIVTDLGCKDGAVKKASSKTVPKGEVISSTPTGPVTLSAGTVVGLTVSSGKPPKHKKAKPKKKG